MTFQRNGYPIHALIIDLEVDVKLWLVPTDWQTGFDASGVNVKLEKILQTLTRISNVFTFSLEDTIFFPFRL